MVLGELKNTADDLLKNLVNHLIISYNSRITKYRKRRRGDFSCTGR